MAVTQKKAPAAEEKGKKPDWVLRCRQEAGSDFFMNAGVGWNVSVNGKDAISLKITALPMSGDGSFLLLPPLEAKE